MPAGVGSRLTSLVLRASPVQTNAPCPTTNTRRSATAEYPAGTYALVDNAGTLVVNIGDGVQTVEKITGADGYGNASAIGVNGFAGNFHLRVNAVALPGGIMIGMNSDPLTDNDYISIDYAWQNPHPALGNIFESGVFIGTVGGSTYHHIWRIGTDLFYGRGDDLAAAQAAPDRTVPGVTGALYADTSLYSVGDKVEVALFDLTIIAIAGSTSLAFASSATISGQGALSGSSSLVLAPTGTVTGKGAITGSTTVVLSPSGTLAGKGTLTGSSTLVLSPSGTIAGKGVVSGASSLTFAPTATLNGRGALSGSAGLTLLATGTLAGQGSLAGTLSLTLAATGLLENAASNIDQITGSASLIFSAAGNVAGLSGLSGSASLAFTLAGSLSSVWFVRHPAPSSSPIIGIADPTGAALTLTSVPAAAGIIRAVSPPFVELEGD